jgi:transcriptional regulator with XRE-family HTH domain
MPTFGEVLKDLRTAAGWTQAQLAEHSSVPLGTIRDYEQGKRDPLLSSAQKLARALGRSLDVFGTVETPGTAEDKPAIPSNRPSKRKDSPPAQNKPRGRKTRKSRGG